MDDLHTAHVGECKGGNQFFLAHHRVPVSGGQEHLDYVALYRFRQDGRAITPDIRRLPDSGAEEEVKSLLLRQLGEHERHDIKVAPFQFAHDGHTFGLIPDSQQETLTLEPGSMITFMEPWDGEYFT